MINYQNKNWKVVVVTPAGREKYLCVLRKYIEKEMSRGIIDGWQLWQNTNIQSDIEYMERMSQENPKIEVKRIEGQGAYDAFRIHLFFRFAQDEDTIYLRFDDDICFVADDAIQALLKCRLENPEPLVVCANIVNNTLISFIHQEMGALGKEAGVCKYQRLDPISWQSSEFVDLTHKNFIEKRSETTLWKYIFTNKKLSSYDPFSISCFAFFGKDKFAPVPDEEMWISSVQPSILSRPNVICGDALVVHFAYHTQRPFLDTKPEYYNYYLQESLSI